MHFRKTKESMRKKFRKFLGWNIFSIAAATVVNLAAIPVYLSELNKQDFALLSILWALTAFSSVLDFGLGRSIIQMISQIINSGEVDKQNVNKIISTSIITTQPIALLISVIIFFLLRIYGSLTIDKFNLSFELVALVSLTVFVSICLNSMLAIVEGTQKIKHNALVKGIGVILFTLVPAILLKENKISSLIEIFYIITITKLLQFVYLLIYILKRHSPLLLDYSIEISKKMLSSGLWLTISNISSLVILYADRFTLGYLLNSKSIAYYSISGDLIQKGMGLIALIPFSLFPLMSESKKSNITTKTLNSILKIQTLISIIGLFVALIFSSYFLKLWLGSEYDIMILNVFLIMSIGLFAAGYGQIYLMRLHSLRNMKVPGKIHMVEMLFFIPVMIVAVISFGVYGAAICFSLRYLIDMILMKNALKNV